MYAFAHIVISQVAQGRVVHSGPLMILWWLTRRYVCDQVCVCLGVGDLHVLYCSLHAVCTCCALCALCGCLAALNAGFVFCAGWRFFVRPFCVTTTHASRICQHQPVNQPDHSAMAPACRRREARRATVGVRLHYQCTHPPPLATMSLTEQVQYSTVPCLQQQANNNQRRSTTRLMRCCKCECKDAECKSTGFSLPDDVCMLESWLRLRPSVSRSYEGLNAR